VETKEFLLDGKVDPQIIDVLEQLNDLGFLQTRFSCAGYGLSGSTGKLHLPNDCAYLVISYNEDDLRTRQFHYELGKIATEIIWSDVNNGFYYNGYAYYFSPMGQRNGQRNGSQANRNKWAQIKELTSKPW